MRSIPEEDQAMGAAQFQIVGQVSQTLGLALATVIQIAVTKGRDCFAELVEEVTDRRCASQVVTARRGVIAVREKVVKVPFGCQS
ncbi:hypothetical protein BDV97DRAFT_107218 [Delphinella strobiligena]|nr:hypothetical protein BDV97DRAFT_107218 [Delphinella strobiligena]